MSDERLWDDRAALKRGLALRGRIIRELIQRLETPEPQTAPKAPGAGAEDEPDGPARTDVLAHIRAAVRKYVPDGSTVAVASGGDAAFLELDDRPAVHFPAAADATYAGDPPLQIEAAIESLEDVRRLGASFLLVPRTAFSWLGECAGFAGYLSERYPALVHDENCILHSLGVEVQDHPRPARNLWTSSPEQLVSVILPVYNAIQPRVGDRWLHETILSVLNQADVRLELVIVDDGSIDGTGHVLDYYDERPVVNVVRLQKWRGLGSAMNIGVEAASGGIIARISVGDRFRTRKLETQLTALHEGEIDVLGSSTAEVDGTGAVVNELIADRSNATIRRELPERLPIAPSSLLMRREVWAKVGGYSTDGPYRFAEDHEFLVRVASHPSGFKFGSLPTPLCEIRTYDGRVSTSALTRKLHEAAVRRVRHEARAAAVASV
jgi:Glycosyl transferase family 2